LCTSNINNKMPHLFFDENGNTLSQCDCGAKFRAAENRYQCRDCKWRERYAEYEPWTCGHCHTRYGPEVDWCGCPQVEDQHQVFDESWQLVTPTYNTSLTFNHPYAFLDFLRFVESHNQQSYFDAGTLSQEMYEMVMSHPVMQRKTRRTRELERRMRRLMNASR